MHCRNIPDSSRLSLAITNHAIRVIVIIVPNAALTLLPASTPHTIMDHHDHEDSEIVMADDQCHHYDHEGSRLSWLMISVTIMIMKISNSSWLRVIVIIIIMTLPMCRWSNMLPASIQVCPVEIPGRGRREGHAAPESVAALASMLVKSLPLDVSDKSA